MHYALLIENQFKGANHRQFSIFALLLLYRDKNAKKVSITVIEKILSVFKYTALKA